MNDGLMVHFFCHKLLYVLRLQDSWVRDSAPGFCPQEEVDCQGNCQHLQSQGPKGMQNLSSVQASPGNWEMDGCTFAYASMSNECSLGQGDQQNYCSQELYCD